MPCTSNTNTKSLIFWEIITLVILIFIFLGLFIPAWIQTNNRITKLEKRNILLEEKISDLKYENRSILQQLEDAKKR